VVILFPTGVFYHLSISFKRGCLTRRPPWPFTNPIWHNDNLCLHWPVLLLLCFHLF